MKLMSRQNGETIIEVLISVAVLGLILTATYGLANKSSQANRQAQERAEALGENSGRIEMFKTYLENDGSIPDTTFCVFEANDGELDTSSDFTGPPIPANAQDDPLTGYPNECRTGTDNRYHTAIQKEGDTYNFITRWDRVNGEGIEEISFVYNTYKASDLDFNPDAGALPSDIVPPPACSDGEDNDDDERIDLADPGCAGNPDRNSEEDPPGPATISRTSYTFPSWHLLVAGGTKRTVNITVSNPSSTAVSNIGSVSLSGRTDSFQIVSNGCANRSLAPNSSCNITVRFAPPGGSSHNYFGNSGVRNATLTVSVEGHANKTTALSGKTYSDRLRPGDSITQTNFGPVPYNPSCYNNVEACGYPLTGIASNGNLYLGGTYCLWGGWGSPPYPGSGNKFAMQTDGNLVFYGINGAYRYASWTIGSNRWLQLQQSGNGVYISHGSGGPLIKWIHYNGGCFQW